MGTLEGLIAVIILIAINGFFVAAEFGLVSARETRINQLAAEGNESAIAVQQITSHLDSYLAATQLGVTLASLALGWVGEPAVTALFDPLLNLLPPSIADTAGHTIGAILAFSIVTIVHITMGELTPKSIALQRSERVALFVARPLVLFRRLFSPVILLMSALGNWVSHALGLETISAHSNVHSAEELEMLVESSAEAGLVPANEERLLKRVFDFGDLQIRQVMRPRTEVNGVPRDIPLNGLLTTIASRHHSRYPIYEGSVDTVVGMLHAKDLLDLIGKNPLLLAENAPPFDMSVILREPLFVPQTTSADAVLDQMQRTKMPFAIVVDEYGGMAGVATMEDILEELVGEVQDEFDAESTRIVTRGDLTMVDGLVSVVEATERFGKPGFDAISTTIGGYVAERLGRIPQVGDIAPFGNYDLRVEVMDGMRAAKVKFIKHPAVPAEPPAQG